MTEQREQSQIITYIRTQYPKVVAWSDMSGIKLPIGLAVKVKGLKTHRGIPDIFIAEPRHGFSGLFIELKRTGEKLTKKSGEWKTEHLQEQYDMLKMLRERNFAAVFAIGFDQAKLLIDTYMKQNLVNVNIFRGDNIAS